MRIYISGPITGTADYMERFAVAERKLRENGWSEVTNPAAQNAQLPKETSWETYMGESLKMLCACDAICLLQGWDRSRGARLELLVAQELGLRVIEQN